MHQLPTSVRPLSVLGHISQTKQDRPVITVEHYWEVGTTDSVAKPAPVALSVTSRYVLPGYGDR